LTPATARVSIDYFNCANLREVNYPIGLLDVPDDETLLNVTFQHHSTISLGRDIVDQTVRERSFYCQIAEIPLPQREQFPA